MNTINTMTGMDEEVQSPLTIDDEDVEQQHLTRIQATQPSRHQLDVSSSSGIPTSSGHIRPSRSGGMLSSLHSSVHDTSIVTSLRQSIQSKKPQDTTEKEHPHTNTFDETIKRVCIDAFGIM